ncbi:MAG: 30S ribosomal protein S6 [Micavibrio aeruginosavorus]|uniref:Small ribosomal subunit protein bS6 n=1 Tax=Micavibrio aeruginosavorus TaxID=349221 RepID=A0A7T5R2Z3_9BACT|nr:MAG: 30S ribosomal protein S6 [Micavibrio aeruginosavorus]
MPFYETVFIARQDLGTPQVEELTRQFSEIITKAGGKIAKTENWGLRNLAYRIKKNRKGHYVLIESDTPAEAMIEMERNMRINEDVLRYMTVRLDELSKGPSPIIDKSRRDEEDEDKFEREVA